jgi:ketosteroid isomerase-like protein
MTITSYSRITTAFAISSTMLVLIGTGHAQAQGQSGDAPAAVRAAIDAGNKKYAEAVAKGDAAMVAAMYTPDALNFNANQEPLKGRQAIQKDWEKLLGGGLAAVAFNTSEVESAGHLAYEVGTYEVKNKGAKSCSAGTTASCGSVLMGNGSCIATFRRRCP